MNKAVIFDLDGVVVDTENTVWYVSSVSLLALYDKVREEEKVKPLLMGCKFEDQRSQATLIWVRLRRYVGADFP